MGSNWSKNEPYARSEYESYVPIVWRLLQENSSMEGIAERLADIARSQMGLSPDKNRCAYSAEILLQHKKAVEEKLG